MSEPIIPADDAVIIISNILDAPREIVWTAFTMPEHVKNWYGGHGYSNPVCEMDVRPGGLWRHVMRFPDGHELHMNFVFLDVQKPARLVWRHADHGTRVSGPPTSETTVTLDDLGERTAWKMVARFTSMADREAALAIGFTKPIEASNARLVDYLKTLMTERA